MKLIFLLLTSLSLVAVAAAQKFNATIYSSNSRDLASERRDTIEIAFAPTVINGKDGGEIKIGSSVYDILFKYKGETKYVCSGDRIIEYTMMSGRKVAKVESQRQSVTDVYLEVKPLTIKRKR